MRANYAEHLAWYQHSVKPHVLTYSGSETRCWHATQKRQPVAYELMRGESFYGKQDSPVPLANPRKRARVQSDSPFLTTMQDEEDGMEEDEALDLTRNSSSFVTSMKPDEAIVFDSEFDNMTLSMEEDEEADDTTTYQKQVSDYDKSIRTMSETSLYYDAEDNWVLDDRIEIEDAEEEQPNPLHTLSLSPSLPPTVISYRREEIESVLHQHFHLKDFIPNQYEAITAALDQENIFLVLPSGPPRNLCYQFPIFFQQPQSNSITIILVPTLLYLLQQDDHVMGLHRIPTIFVSKSKSTYKKNWIPRQQLNVKSIKDTKLIYITYDDFSSCKNTIKQFHDKKLISRFIIDEAHCISQWRTDFHFKYLRIAEYITATWPSIPITALTAIPNERIHLDIMNNLSITNTCKIFKKSILL